jgi:DNA-binding GntR family transcriptional regulator
MTNHLHRQLANRILLHVRATGLPPGHHLTEASLQHLLGTSRAPIRAALALLAAEGLLDQRRNRGFFVKSLPVAPSDLADRGEPEGDERIYLKIAEDRLTGQIGTTVTEPEMIRRYHVPRPQLRRILARISREGWIERREGRGYAFPSLMDSVEAYRESYELRQMLEPAGLLAASFSCDAAVLEQLNAQQEFVRNGGWQTLSQIELFETNSKFHEGLARMSGNRFLVHIVERQNQLRRLVEYRHILNRQQVLDQNVEHLQILARLESNDVIGAARLLSEHLGNAKTRKARAEIFAA